MSGCGWALLRGSRDASVLGPIRTIAAAALCGKFASMARALIDPENSFWRNAAGAVAAAILIPIAIVVKLISMPFERPAKRKAEEVAQYLRGFLNNSGGEWDWDDFTSVPLANPTLESIRQRAASVELPVTDEGRRTLVALLAEAEAASESDRA